MWCELVAPGDVGHYDDRPDNQRVGGALVLKFLT
jgi:hypothetical protein